MCAELGRRDILATPFAGNVPGFDVIATGERQKTVPIQVKTSNRTAWVMRLDPWLHITFDKRRKRHVLHGKRRLQNPDLIFVFVRLDKKQGDCFYIVTPWRVREIIFKNYKRVMEPRDYRRPQTPESMHWVIHERDLEHWVDNWKLIMDRCEGKKSTRR